MATILEMKKKVEYFNWSDAWVFTSLFIYDSNFRKINLVNILANGDALNHAILEFDELNSGLNKLIKSELIVINENQIRLTKLGIETKASSKKLKGGLFEKVNNTLKVINRLRMNNHSNEIIEFEFLSEEKLDNAYNEYKH